MWALPTRFPASRQLSAGAGSAQLCPLTCRVLPMGGCNTPEIPGEGACSTPATLTRCGLGLKRKQVTTWPPFCAGRLDTACRLMRSLPGLINMNYHNYSVYESVITTQNPAAVLLKVQPRTQNLSNSASGLKQKYHSFLY